MMRKILSTLFLSGILFSATVEIAQASSFEDISFSEEREHKKYKRLQKLSQIHSDEEEQGIIDVDDLSFSEDEQIKPLKRLKKLSETHPSQEDSESDQPIKISDVAPDRIRNAGCTNPNFRFKEDADEDSVGRQTLNNDDFVSMGLGLKFLTNVYLRNLDQTANIFLPRFTIMFTDAKGYLVPKTDYFRTPKNQICVFASGGLQNVWEKNIDHIYRLFFGKEIKIIRSSWIQSYLYRKKKQFRNFSKEFKGRENELHSEFYFDLFVEHFFKDQLDKEVGRGVLKTITIDAFSWWDVCNGCEKRLSHRKDRFLKDVQVSYRVYASRPYQHHYPPETQVQGFRNPRGLEKEVWDAIWSKVKAYTELKFSAEKRKEHYWTRSKDGLEVCKWLGQAFSENRMDEQERERHPSQQGDIIKFYQEMTEESTKPLKDLLVYLREKNWELSCWYKHKFPSPLQRKWKKNWRQVVIPHFKWELLGEDKCEDDDGVECELCGKSDIINTFWIFHPKFRVSKSFLAKSIEEQEQTAAQLGIDLRTPLDQVPVTVQQKRKQSLIVGSECVQIAELTQAQLAEWFAENGWDDLETKWEEWEQRQAENDALEKAEKEMSRRKRKKKQTHTRSKRRGKKTLSSQ